MEDKVLKALNITPTVYMLRVAHIVLHTLFPVAGALILVAEKMMPLGIISYAIMTLSIFAIMIFLALDFNKLPRTIYGMMLVLLSPIVAFLVYKFAFGISVEMSFLWTVTQELTFIVFLAFYFLKSGKETSSFATFMYITAGGALYAVGIFTWYLWQSGELAFGSVFQWVLPLFLLIWAWYQAKKCYVTSV